MEKTHPVWWGIWKKWKSCLEKCGGTRVTWNFFLGLERGREFWELKGCSIFNKGRIKMDFGLGREKSGTRGKQMEAQTPFTAPGSGHRGMWVIPKVGKILGIRWR